MTLLSKTIDQGNGITLVSRFTERKMNHLSVYTSESMLHDQSCCDYHGHDCGFCWLQHPVDFKTLNVTTSKVASSDLTVAATYSAPSCG